MVITGLDNNDLVDKLVQANYIKTAQIEKVFRAVDRAAYFLPDFKTNAYKDGAFKSGNIHVSAPTIYSIVMENLKLAPSLSFLNVGSGTGYLSTMAGLMLGLLGVNHGIELHSDVIKYANQKMVDFKKNLLAWQGLEFCEPIFIKGNGLCLPSGFPQYDRVYCGATCPESHEEYMKNLIKVGGVLVMPYKNQLLQITRTSQKKWENKLLCGVLFSDLQLPSAEDIKNNISLSLETTAVSDVPTLPTTQSVKCNAVELLGNKQDQHSQLRSLLEAVEELAKCGVCFQVLASNVNQCQRGHGVCSQCFSQLINCPTCKEPFLLHKPTLLIQVLELLPKLCKYADRGCQVIHSTSENHSLYCEYRSIKCKFAGSQECKWSEIVKDFKNHVQEQHCGNIFFNQAGKVYNHYISCFKSAWKATCSLHVIDNNMFFLHKRKDEANKRFILFVKHLPVNELGPSYYFIVTFSKQDIVYKHSIKATAITNQEELLDDSPYSMIVPMDEAHHFLTNNGSLEAVLQVKKV